MGGRNSGEKSFSFISSEWTKILSTLKTDTKAASVEHSPTPPPVPPRISSDEEMGELKDSVTDSSVPFTDPHNSDSSTGRVLHNPRLNEGAASLGEDDHCFQYPLDHLSHLQQGYLVK